MPFIQTHFKQRLIGIILAFVGAYLTLLAYTGTRDGQALSQTARLIFCLLGLAILAVGGYIFIRNQRKSDAARRAYYQNRKETRNQINPHKDTPPNE